MTWSVTPSGVHFRDEVSGSGPAVVLVHGGFCTSSNWRHQIAALSAAGRRVIAVDLPGHGRSPHRDDGSFAVADIASAVLDVLPAAGVDRCVLVGHSYGGRVVLEAAHRMPSVVTGVVLVDGNRAAPGTQAAGESPILAAIETMGAARFLADLFAGMFVLDSDPRVRAEVLDGLAAVDPRAVAPLVSAIVTWDRDRLDEVLDGLTVDVLAVQSTSFTPDGARRSLEGPADRGGWPALLRERVPGVRIEVVPGVGHFPMLEVPGTVTSALTDFFAVLEHRVPR